MVSKIKLTKLPISLNWKYFLTTKSVISSHDISSSDKYNDIPLLYWIPKLHTNPYKQRFIAGSLFNKATVQIINNNSLQN